MASRQPQICILYILDFNVGNASDDQDDPFNAGRLAVGSSTGGTLKTLIDHKQMPDGIDVLLEEGGRLIWTLMGHPNENDGRVQASRLDGSDIRDIYSAGEIHTPKQIKIDPVSRKLYVCDREGLRVHRSNLDGSEKEVLIQRGDWRNAEHQNDRGLQCVGIAVDLARGKFYWTQKGPSKGGQGRIYRANIDMPKGQTAENRDDIELLFEKLPEPIDLAFDTDSQMIYWTDRGELPKGNTLNRADVSESVSAGEKQEKREYTILARHLHEAIGLELDQINKHIYVTDLGGCVYQYDMSGKHAVKLFEEQGEYTGIALAHLEPRQAFELYGIK